MLWHLIYRNPSVTNSWQIRSFEPQVSEKFMKLVVVEKSIKLIACLSSRRLSLLSPGFLLFKDFCMNEIDEAVPQLKFYEEVSVPSVSLQDCLWKDNSP